MGFLLGAYAKQMAGKRVRSLQARMVHVQSQLRRATRDIQQRENYWNQVIKDTKNSVTAQANALVSGIGAGLQDSIWKNLGEIKDKNGATISLDALKNYDQAAWSSLDTNSAQAINAKMNEANQQNARVTQALQATLQQTLAMQEQDVEMQKEAELQLLHDYEDELETEKNSLDSQIQLAQQDYDACKEMEKAGAKNMAPTYTGQS